MSNLRKRQAAKKIAGAAALTAAAPGGGGACDSERALLPLIAALAREIFLELHRDELGCLGQGGRVVAVMLGLVAGTGQLAHALLSSQHSKNGQGVGRSEERRVGNECVSTCRYRWAP